MVPEKKSKKRVKICPICKSPSLTPYMGFITGVKYRCRKCGYVGSFFIEIEVEDDKVKDERG